MNTHCNLNTTFIVFGRRFLQALRREDASTRWPLKGVQVVERFNQNQISEEKYNKLRQISRGSLVLFKSIFCTCDSLLIGFILWAWPQGVGYPKGFLNLVKIRCVLYCFALSFYCVQFLS